jgi:hypothetical protein
MQCPDRHFSFLTLDLLKPINLLFIPLSLGLKPFLNTSWPIQRGVASSSLASILIMSNQDYHFAFLAYKRITAYAMFALGRPACRVGV